MKEEKKLSLLTLDSDSKKTESSELNLECSKENSNYIVHRALIKQLNNRRQGTASTKTRSEVRGGGRKPWRQKGTGKARAGSNTSPIWRGGGVCFGPKSRRYFNKMNTKEFHLAMNNLLQNRKDEIVVVQNFSTVSSRTKDFLKQLDTWQLQNTKRKLIVLSRKNPNMLLATRNIPYIEIVLSSSLNIYAILKSETIIIEKSALDIISQTYSL